MGGTNKDVPIFAVIDNYGEVVREIGAAENVLLGAYVMSAEEYNIGFNHSTTGVANGHLLFSREQYNAKSFMTSQQEPIYYKPPLPEDAYSALVLSQSEILTPYNNILLKTYPVDYTQSKVLQENSVSVLITNSGLKHDEATNPIGYRSAYLTPIEGDFSADSSTAVNAANSNKLLGPIKGIIVENSLGGRGLTKSNGSYWTMNFLPPCPGFNYEIMNWMTAKFPYVKANPKAERAGSFIPLSVFSPIYCTGISSVFLPGTVDLHVNQDVISNNLHANIPVDALMLTGSAFLTNRYQGGTRVLVGDQSETDPTITLVGAVEDKTIYAYEPYAETRLMPKGLLERISKEDLANTDLYVFRESDGEMVAEKEGLDEAFIEDVAVDDIRRIRFQQMLYGFRDTFVGKTHPARKAGLRFGEMIQVILINRSTGYMASKRIKAEPTTGTSSSIEIKLKDMEMRPPNLLFQVKREVETPFIRPDTGMEVTESQIAFEGAGLTSDKKVIINSAWFDHEGKALPEKLPGFTGRLTKVTSVNTLADKGSGVVEFEVMPNLHLQQVKFPTPIDPTAKENFYLHVHAENKKSGNYDFSTNQDAYAALKYRPKSYVPFLVQIPDIAASAQQKFAALMLDAMSAYQPVYDWHYRPELQYTLVGFKPKEIQPAATMLMPDGETQIINLTDSASVRYLGGAQALDLPSIINLDRFGTQSREFSFDLSTKSGQLVKVTINNKGIASISDPSILSSVDFTTISLFQNDDPENILWAHTPICGSCKANRTGPAGQ